MLDYYITGKLIGFFPIVATMLIHYTVVLEGLQPGWLDNSQPSRKGGVYVRAATRR